MLGLACVAITVRPIARAVKRGITAQRRRWRWAWVVGGSLVFLLVPLAMLGLACVAITARPIARAV
jgi:hypothetical protein